MIDYSRINSWSINQIEISVAIVLFGTILIMGIVGWILKSLNMPNFVLKPVLGLGTIFVLYGLLIFVTSK